MQCELEYVLHVLFGPDLALSEGDQTPAWSLGSGNLCSHRVFRIAEDLVEYPTALATYLKVDDTSSKCHCFGRRYRAVIVDISGTVFCPFFK